MSARAATVLAFALLAPPLTLLAQGGAVSTTVSVPLADGDSATVTGVLAVRHRNGQQFLVLQSPTPYSLVHDHQAGEHTGKLVRDIPIELQGRDADLSALSGRTLTAKGHLLFQPAATSWNGALLQASVVILPGGKELRPRH